MNKRKPLYESLAAADIKAQYDDYVKRSNYSEACSARCFAKQNPETAVRQMLRK